MFLFDTEALDHALSLPLDAKLRRLLRARVDHLATVDRAVADTTYFLIIDRNSAMEEIEDQLGWSPLVDLDGERFGSDAFVSCHEFIADRGGWFELMYSASNEAVVTLLIRDDLDNLPELTALCRDCLAVP